MNVKTIGTKMNDLDLCLEVYQGISPGISPGAAAPLAFPPL